MGRFQKGNVYKASGAFYVRYWVTEIVDGTPQRVQRSKFLCREDKQHCVTAKKQHGKTRFYFNAAVKAKCSEFMREINSEQAKGHIEHRVAEHPHTRPGQATQSGLTVAEFWEQTYLPFVTKNKNASTVHGYKQIWNQHLKSHFGQMTLKEYRTPIGSKFLTSLADTLGRNTLQHIRSLASGIFTHAVNTGDVESNPWHDVKILGKVKPPGETEHYTLEEVENIISALVDHVDCQLVVALAFFLGLRPGEIQGLRWEDVDESWIHIRRAVARGVVGETETKTAARLPLITPVLIPMRLWRSELAKRNQTALPSEGWMFPNKNDKPVELRTLISRVIVPTLKEKHIEWKTLYAGRRGAATILTELTGNALAAQSVLRHKTPKTTEQFYAGRS